MPATGEVELVSKTKVTGWAHDKDQKGPITVTLVANGIPLRSTRADLARHEYKQLNDGRVGFRFDLGPALLPFISAKGGLRVTASGTTLPIVTNTLKESGSPEGSREKLQALLDQGYLLTRTGNFRPDLAASEDWRNRMLDLYAKARETFREASGYDLFLTKSTLLGVTRSGDLIRGDDSFDVAYLSARTSAGDVRQELLDLLSFLHESGAKTRVAPSKTWFSWNLGKALWVNVYPSWIEGRRFFHAPAIEGPAADFKAGLVEQDFKGHPVMVPKAADSLLASMYGSGWRKPDPQFEWTAARATARKLKDAALSKGDLKSIYGPAGKWLHGAEARSTEKKGPFNTPLILIDGKVPLRWWTVAENFGDLLGPWLIKRITKRDVVFAESNQPHYMAVGSILKRVGPQSIVWGVGCFGTESPAHIPQEATFLAVRGPLTRNKLTTAGIPCPRVYGDPALLVPEFHQPRKRVTHEIGIVLRWSERQWEKSFNVRGVKKIFLKSDDIEGVLDDMCSCRNIISSSLHGLIIADAYGIPNAWLDSKTPKGTEFKFWDYFISINKLRDPQFFDMFGPGMTVEKIMENISFDGRPIGLDLKPLKDANPFGWRSEI